jgi:hypothetical protein
MNGHRDALDDLNSALEREGTDCVLQLWVQKLPWKQQSILIERAARAGPRLHAADQAAQPVAAVGQSEQRGPEQGLHGDWQDAHARVSGPGAGTLALPLRPPPGRRAGRDCLQPPGGWTRSGYAAKLHYFIAEEIFHFQPEPPETFRLRHRDKRSGKDDDMKLYQWMRTERENRNVYFSKVMARFNLSA